MFKQFKIADATIEITEEGKVTYSVGKKKTTFDLSDCDSITYDYSADKTVITEDMLSGTDEFEPWMWLVINEGENALSITMIKQKPEDITATVTKTISGPPYQQRRMC